MPFIGVDKITELYLWLKVTQCFTESDMPLYLRIAGLSDGTYNGPFKMQMFGLTFSTKAGKIANTIVEE
jgi:hypothetical protein